MAQQFLKVSTSGNRLLNQDGITALRSINLVQGETYTIRVAFFYNSTEVFPEIDTFAFFIRAVGGSSNLLEVSDIEQGTGEYPYSFALNLSSPSLSAVIGSQEQVSLVGFITWTADGDTELLEPFTVNVTNAGTAGEVDYVMSLNGLVGSVGITGDGVAVSIDGNNVKLTVEASEDVEGYVTYATTGTPATRAILSDEGTVWLVDATLSNATLTLPASATVDGREYRFKKTDATANKLTVRGAGSEKIDGRDGVFVESQGDIFTLLAAGGAWVLLGAVAVVDP